MTYVLDWLSELAAAAPILPRAQPPRVYYSQRKMATQPTLERSLPEIARRVRLLVQELNDEQLFAETFGYDCVDGHGYSENSPEQELDKRVGKPHLWSDDPETWSEDDLYDFIEVFYDLTARPTRGLLHSYNNCGWHPTHFDRSSGRALYGWRMNRLLDTTRVALRIAESGRDIGRMVQMPSGELGKLVTDALQSRTPSSREVSHAIEKFRSRHTTREEQQSAVRDLAAVLEGYRPLLKSTLTKKDESALFEIANKFNIRHRGASQYTDYGSEFLEWVFYWYLATVQLCEKLETAASFSRRERRDA